MIEEVLDRNPYARLARQFRRELNARSARFEDLHDSVATGGQPAVATLKIDGELAVIHAHVDPDFCVVYNREGRARWDFPAAAEVIALLRAAGRTDVIAFGELHVADRQGVALRRDELTRVLRTRVAQRTPRDLERLHLAIFDLYRLDADVLWGRTPYPDRYAVIQTLFAGGAQVAPVAGEVLPGEDWSALRDWQTRLAREDQEGLVLRINRTVTVEMLHHVDVAVIGYAPGTGRYSNTVGSLALAFRRPNGEYVYAGRVSGLTVEERDRYKSELEPTGQKLQKIILTKPGPVVAVEAERFKRVLQPGLLYHPRERRWERLLTKRPAVSLTRPRYVEQRIDMDVSLPGGLQMSQVPGWSEGPEVDLEAFARKIQVPEAEVREVVRAILRRDDLPTREAQYRALRDMWGRRQREAEFAERRELAAALVPDPVLDPEGKKFRAAMTQVVAQLRAVAQQWANAKKIPADDMMDLVGDTIVKTLEAWEKRKAGIVGRTGKVVGPRPGEPLGAYMQMVMENTRRDMYRKQKGARAEFQEKVREMAEGRLRARGLAKGRRRTST